MKIENIKLFWPQIKHRLNTDFNKYFFDASYCPQCVMAVINESAKSVLRTSRSTLSTIKIIIKKSVFNLCLIVILVSLVEVSLCSVVAKK